MGGEIMKMHGKLKKDLSQFMLTYGMQEMKIYACSIDFLHMKGGE